MSPNEQKGSDRADVVSKTQGGDATLSYWTEVPIGDRNLRVEVEASAMGIEVRDVLIPWDFVRECEGLGLYRRPQAELPGQQGKP